MRDISSAIRAFLGGGEEQDSSSGGGLNRNALLFVHMNLIMYSCAFWMQQPVMPEKIRSINATELEYGSLQSFSAIVSLFGSSFMGRVVDVWGARNGLILAQLGSALMYGIPAISTSMTTMYLVALPSFFQHAMLCSSAAVATLSSESLRALALGRLGLSYGIGMGIGSSIGGLIAKEYGITAAFVSASCISVLFALANVLFLPTMLPSSSNKQEPQAESEENKKKESVSSLDLGAILRVANSSKSVRDLLILSFASGLATSAFRAMFALAAVDDFGLGPQELGLLMSFNAAVSLLTNVFLIGWVVSYLGETDTLIYSTFVQGLSFLGVYFVPHTSNMLILISIPQSVASTMFYTLASSMLTKSVTTQNQGTVISLSHAARSLTQVLAPLVGGFVMRRFQFAGVGMLAACISFLGGMFAAYTFERAVIPVKLVGGITETAKEEKVRTD